jgi:hypothetical protein
MYLREIVWDGVDLIGEIGWIGMDWTNMAQDKKERKALVNTQ